MADIREPIPVQYAGREAVYVDTRETDWRLLVAVLVLIIGPLIGLCQFIAVWRVDVVDDQMFAYFGWRIAHGATVYRDVWDNKPPGIYWINALAMGLSGGSYAGVVVACVVALVTAFTSFFIACASVYFRTAATLTTILLSFFLMHGVYTGGTNRTETFLVAFELTAVALYMRGWARDRWWCWLAAGSCAGFAFLCKQTGLAAWGAMLVHLTLCAVCRDISFLVAVRRAALLVAGVVAIVGAACALLAAQGALADAYYATFGFNRLYFEIGQSQFPYSYRNFHQLRNETFPILTLPYLLATAALIHSALWRMRPLLRPQEIDVQVRRMSPVCPRHMVMLFIWWAAAAYGATLSPHYFRHYIIPSIPPLIMMGGYILSMMVTEQRLLQRLQQRAWVTLAFVAMGWFALDAVIRQWESMSVIWIERVELHQPAEWEPIAASIAQITNPDDKIQCWGYQPGVYLWSKRANTCRFTTTEKVGQIGERARFVLDELDEKLRAEPPVAIAISARDYEWMHDAHPELPRTRSLLGPWLDENYVIVEDNPKFNIYVMLRRDRAPAAQPSDVRPTQSRPGAGRPTDD